MRSGLPITFHVHLHVKFWQMDHVLASAVLATFVLHMCITGHTCTSGIKYWLPNLGQTIRTKLINAPILFQMVGPGRADLVTW